MHVLVDLEASWSPGKLWLGGEFASGDVKLLMDNNITTVLPASRKPSPAESLNIRVLPYVDGTALASGSVPLAEFLEVADSLINEMLPPQCDAGMRHVDAYDRLASRCL